MHNTQLDLFSRFISLHNLEILYFLSPHVYLMFLTQIAYIWIGAAFLAFAPEIDMGLTDGLSHTFAFAVAKQWWLQLIYRCCCPTYLSYTSIY